ncbi:hypothetical protein CK203_081707 [Vitis vinifera]|uniref:O-methyltransferase domain-containing protein n=1 Tax=Vitis vinifera TaxID=29760 RepID=A0A438EFD7_VITVI|nr:hypothetical protein CK203_081707 [Vitis vinifera]
MASWHCFGTCVKEGVIAFEKAHDRQIWDFALENSVFNNLFNDGVGGGTGRAVVELVKAYPHITV